ncbi:hypothetical protein [Vibrio phage vB_VmeM-Yong XC32]|nr:hypothetical protein [Vibrio phage vB_VmeM-Yong XC31]QAX96525.1 hypothetical protein [Vibrio phage vB_VmeM-Yong XC32]QAX96843.1 hypothetical protein [Vibrio phage vB_VmeM-Yong MS31]QAX97148.1 hypothetical protein [Vibrio phage vB_VmeM-Yong MS32]
MGNKITITPAFTMSQDIKFNAMGTVLEGEVIAIRPIFRKDKPMEIRYDIKKVILHDEDVWTQSEDDLIPLQSKAIGELANG